MPSAVARRLYWFCFVTGTLAFLASVGLVILYVFTNEPGAKYLGALAAAVAVGAYVVAAVLRPSRRARFGFDVIPGPPSDT